MISLQVKVLRHNRSENFIDHLRLGVAFEEGKKHFLKVPRVYQTSFIFNHFIQLLSKIIKDSIIQVQLVDLFDSFDPLFILAQRFLCLNYRAFSIVNLFPTSYYHLHIFIDCSRSQSIWSFLIVAITFKGVSFPNFRLLQASQANRSVLSVRHKIFHLSVFRICYDILLPRGWLIRVNFFWFHYGMRILVSYCFK